MRQAPDRAAAAVTRTRWVAVLLSAAAVLCGCGGAPSRPVVKLMLDFTPNAVHAGIYTALVRGFDRQAGIQLEVAVPGASTDAVRLLQTGRVQFAILDIHDLALARARGVPLVGVMAIVERPLASVITAPAIRTPRDLEHRLVGVTGLPSDLAVLRSEVKGAGGDPRRVRTVAIGFNAVEALLAGRVSAATAFWDDEGVAIRRRRPGFHVFRVEDYGAPSYPELVLCASRQELQGSGPTAHALVSALVRGYEAVLADPGAGAAALQARVPGLDPTLVAAELAALAPVFRGAGGHVGTLEAATLEAWARWEAAFGIVRHPPDVGAEFDFALGPRS